MRKTIVGSAAALLLVLAPAPGQSQAWLGSPVCTSGSLVACLSVQDVSWIQGEGQGSLTFTVTNLYPTLGMEHTITRIGFYQSDGSWDGELLGVDEPDGWGDNFSAIETHQGIDLDFGAGTQGVNNGIGPGEGPITFSLVLSEEFAFSDVSHLRFHSQRIGENGEYSVKCDTQLSDPGGSYPPCTTVPEPMTMLLLGTGMLGVGGVAIRRRRRDEEDDVEELV